jgi:hypothetical protein
VDARSGRPASCALAQVCAVVTAHHVRSCLVTRANHAFRPREAIGPLQLARLSIIEGEVVQLRVEQVRVFIIIIIRPGRHS